MNFELLPNEIILDLFEYFSIIHLFHAFYDLNLRFKTQLLIHFRKFYLDFQIISKTNFNHICQNYLPYIIDRILTLRLSNDDDTPQQIELFLSRNHLLRQFTSLQSISLSHVRSLETLDKLMIECSYLPSLTHLTFIDGHISMNEDDAKRLFNQIWSLPKLTYCRLSISFAYENYFPYPTIISTSLKHLDIQHTSCHLSQLTHLYQYTPHLKYLSINFENNPDNLELSLPILSINRLKILFYSTIDVLECLLRNVPDLYHLTFEAYHICINGYQWEEMIKKYLLKLKIFQFKTSFLPSDNEHKENKMNEILDSFRTKFWINEHQWFVRCHWYSRDEERQVDCIEIFTLPYTFKNFSTYSNCHLAKSTSLHDNEYLICNNVNHLYYGPSNFLNSITSRIRFYNIQHLSLSFPFNNEFLSVVSKLDQLNSLYVFIDKNKSLDNIQSELQSLLNQAPRLYSLSFGPWPLFNTQMPPMNITSNSIRKLNLQGYDNNYEWRCYNDEQCIQLSNSLLGKQCETLLIKVKNRTNVIDLINNMPNLQALNVRCEDDNYINENDLISLKEDELIEWLRNHLPSTYIITRDINLIGDIRLWIR